MRVFSADSVCDHSDSELLLPVGGGRDKDPETEDLLPGDTPMFG